jgi:hypothetical protein
MLTAHGLRKLGATRCSDAGATAHELMAIFGWTKIAQPETYARNADRSKLEAGAAHKLQRRGATPAPLPEQAGNKSALDFKVVLQSGAISGKKA